MKQWVVATLVLLSLFLAACASPAAEEAASTDGDSRVVTVYRPPT